MFVDTRKRYRGLRQYVTRDAAAFNKSVGIKSAPSKKRPRFLGALGCGSCAGKCGGCKTKSLGDWSDVLDSITQVATTTVPVIVNRVLAPSQPTYTVDPNSGSLVNTTGLTPAQIAALTAQSQPSGLSSTVNIGGYNVPVWALGLGGVGALFAFTR